MTKEVFIPRRFKAEASECIRKMNAIIEEYQEQGFTLTLRQLFYQFVARGLRPNTIKTYTYLGYVLRNARLAGEVDWDVIEDRTRETCEWASWDDPEELVRKAAAQYAENPWVHQGGRPFVWIEKAALVNVVEPACRDWHVPYFAVRGYNSASEMYAAGKEFKRLRLLGVRPVVLYLGDHDPSGINMPRVAQRDLSMFAEAEVDVIRLGLNLDQVRRHRLPPNVAKETDKRYPAYIEEFGTDECWELDALEPTMVDQLLREAIGGLVDNRRWRAAKAREKKNRTLLARVADNWEEIAEEWRE
jgi:hypothetical protein